MRSGELPMTRGCRAEAPSAVSGELSGQTPSAACCLSRSDSCEAPGVSRAGPHAMAGPYVHRACKPISLVRHAAYGTKGATRSLTGGAREDSPVNR